MSSASGLHACSVGEKRHLTRNRPVPSLSPVATAGVPGPLGDQSCLLLFLQSQDLPEKVRTGTQTHILTVCALTTILTFSLL